MTENGEQIDREQKTEKPITEATLIPMDRRVERANKVLGKKVRFTYHLHKNVPRWQQCVTYRVQKTDREQKN